ncbi:CPBP family intramembrane glutamic endopeptidase [Mycolicibacterium moriokaense]|jgi:membrane protease YdiL (CAAX protease family)|uniref:CAAX prenyl protease 2/Lysostaphin resistance protein A-like domain-containing protein n=1 Tax=Mycolicibacterium moriokaense TaxID=39691 RepID=A0A318HKX1_9MYCO|nr:type II CAAX endopeptidase family protein [Mycolicibacterium moriokaense]PXX08873.1 hypothetical protein C8E89_107178 [Mycolicibacterium moriokaense]
MTEPAPTHPEPSAVIRRRRVIVAAVVVIGGALLGFSLTRQAGDTSFFWLTLALAAVWTVGAFASGPLHLGSNRHPVISGTVIGLALGGLFVAGGMVAREIPGVREYITRVLEFANYGPLALVVFITVLNGIAEELFFRGALYTALGKAYPAVVSTVIYVIATSATTGNPMLGVAALVVGAVCAFERRSTGGVLAPMLTHFFWGLVMVLALPPVFGV